jgi:hypothetical protein
MLTRHPTTIPGAGPPIFFGLARFLADAYFGLGDDARSGMSLGSETCHYHSYRARAQCVAFGFGKFTYQWPHKREKKSREKCLSCATNPSKCGKRLANPARRKPPTQRCPARLTHLREDHHFRARLSRRRPSAPSGLIDGSGFARAAESPRTLPDAASVKRRRTDPHHSLAPSPRAQLHHTDADR